MVGLIWAHGSGGYERLGHGCDCSIFDFYVMFVQGKVGTYQPRSTYVGIYLGRYIDLRAL